MKQDNALFATMLLIRRFEERVLAEFAGGKLVGTTHTYIGQEANAAGIFAATDAEDVVFSNHRCHGHFLAYGGDPYLLFSELMGRAAGLVGGRGGSQHIQWKNFYSNGVQGGIVPVAAGMAMAEKVKQEGRITLAFLGDGTLGQGVVYETMNIAALWQLPILFVVENNHIAQTTPVGLGVAGSIPARFQAFGIRTWEKESSDVKEIQSAAKEAIGFVRNSQPAGLILHTYRFMAHSKGDDTRGKSELTRIKKFDPLLIHGGRINESERKGIEQDVAARIQDCFSRAELEPFPDATFLINKGDG